MIIHISISFCGSTINNHGGYNNHGYFGQHGHGGYGHGQGCGGQRG